MAKKQKNYRLSEETLEQLTFLVREKNQELMDLREKYGWASELKLTETDVIASLIELEYKAILAKKQQTLQTIEKAKTWSVPPGVDFNDG